MQGEAGCYNLAGGLFPGNQMVEEVMGMEKVCKASDVPKAAMKGFTVKGRQVLVANIDGSFYAVNALCPHMNGYLPSGRLEKNELVCPKHGARYDVMTGRLMKNVPAVMRMATGRGSRDLQTFKVKVEADDILVDI
jgi:3-phenylpropionate/trans-cinnamate dioxygenase ferredoxin component